MNNSVTLIESFFKKYERNVNDALNGREPDTAEVAGSFAQAFVGANPNGVAAGPNDESFLKAIQDGWAFYRQVGVKAMNILSNDITVLDEFHAMSSIRWQCVFVRKDMSRGEIIFNVIYIVQIRDAVVKIFAYITGDEQSALRECGLIS